MIATRDYNSASCNLEMTFSLTLTWRGSPPRQSKLSLYSLRS